MAKKASEPTAAANAVLDLRQKLELARAADTKATTEKTKAAVADLESKLKEAVNIDNRERFVRIVNNRHKKAKTAMRNLANLASPRSYTYSEADVVALESSLAVELKSTLTKLRAALNRGGAANVAEEDNLITS